MTMPAFPAQGSTSWYTYAQSLDDERRTGRLSDASLQASFGTWLPGAVDTTPITAADFGLVAPVGVRALSAPATAQVVGNAAYPVYLDLTSTDFNDDGTVFTVDTTGDKITVAVGGIYLIDWGVGFTPTASTTQEAYITKNAGNALAAASGGSSGQASGSFRLRLTAGDYVQVIAYVEGAAVTIHNQAFRNWLHLERIGL